MKYAVLSLAMIILLLLPACTAKHSSPKDESGKFQLQRYDTGPATRDVTQYPMRVQWWYSRYFKAECSKCHSIARPLNVGYKTDEEWDSVIKRMNAKPGATISWKGKLIHKFLVYDAKKKWKKATTPKN